MKTIKLLLILALPLLMSVSCNVVTFEKPMPLDGKTEKSFNQSLVGTYYAADRMFDSTTYNEKYYPNIYKKKDSVDVSSFKIIISENTVRYIGIDKKYYDTTKIDLNTISLKPLSNSVRRKNIGSYVLIESIEQEETVNLNKDVLKEKDGIYYVNKYNDDDEWVTAQVIKGKKGALTVNILSSDEFKNLPDGFNIEKTGMGSVTLHNVTASQFDYLVKNKYFEKLFSLKKE